METSEKVEAASEAMEVQDTTTQNHITFIRPGTAAHKRARIFRTQTPIPSDDT